MVVIGGKQKVWVCVLGMVDEPTNGLLQIEVEDPSEWLGPCYPSRKAARARMIDLLGEERARIADAISRLFAENEIEVLPAPPDGMKAIHVISADDPAEVIDEKLRFNREVWAETIRAIGEEDATLRRTGLHEP